MRCDSFAAPRGVKSGLRHTAGGRRPSSRSFFVLAGVHGIVSFQIKMVLAILASGFGDCHPVVVIAGVEAAVLTMLCVNW